MEVAETQLPRRLTFSDAKGRQLTLLVTAGRVLCGAEPTSTALLEGHVSSVAFMSGRRVDDQSAIVRVTQAFAAQTDRIEVHSTYDPMAEAQAAQGFELDAQAVTPAGTDEEAPGVEETTLTDIIRLCEANAAAGLVTQDGQASYSFGSEADVSLLEALAQKEALQPSQTEGPRCVIYASHPKEGRAVLCASQGNTLGLLSFRLNALRRLLPHLDRFMP